MYCDVENELKLTSSRIVIHDQWMRQWSGGNHNDVSSHEKENGHYVRTSNYFELMSLLVLWLYEHSCILLIISAQIPCNIIYIN